MDWRPGVLKRHDLKEKCYDLVTADRMTFWEFTLLRLKFRKIDLGGVLRCCVSRAKS